MQVKFCAGNIVGQADDEKLIMWDESETSSHDLMKDALLWAAGRFPESDGEYDSTVWIESMDGDVIDSEDVTVGADGEMEFPA